MLRILLILLASMTLYACKEAVPGCTNTKAENYNVNAEEDDGTCSYRGSAVVYHDTNTGQALLNDGITNVKLYVDGTFWDSMSPNTGFSFTPTCDHPDAMLMPNFGIGNVQSKSFSYQIKDQNNVVISTGTFEIRGNECTAVKYEY